MRRLLTPLSHTEGHGREEGLLRGDLSHQLCDRPARHAGICCCLLVFCVYSQLKNMLVWLHCYRNLRVFSETQ